MQCAIVQWRAAVAAIEAASRLAAASRPHRPHWRHTGHIDAALANEAARHGRRFDPFIFNDKLVSAFWRELEKGLLPLLFLAEIFVVYRVNRTGSYSENASEIIRVHLTLSGYCYLKGTVTVFK